MSTSGVFSLITNDGIQDKLLTNNAMLSERIKQVSYLRFKAIQDKYPKLTISEIEKQYKDAWMPTLMELEKTHVLFINPSFKPFVTLAHEYSKTVPRGGKPDLGNTFSFSLPIIGQFINDPVLHVRLSGFAATSALDKVRYCELIGHRLMKKVSLKVQNAAMDSYTPDAMNVHYQFKVPQHKETGYLRGVGQEIPNLGFLTADPTVDEVREYRYFGAGAQTFKNTQPVLDMWIPLLFWFKDVQCSLPNFILPLNQTEIEIEFEGQANLIAYSDYGGGGAYTAPSVAECSLFLNHIYLNEDVFKIFIGKYGFQLIRVHLTHTEQINKSSDKILLQQLKWPIETLYVSFRPRANLTNSQKWYRPMYITNTNVKEAVVTGVATIQVNNAVYFTEIPLVTELGLESHGITMYPNIVPEFYNNYIPYRYGKDLKTPKDLGWYMFSFAFNPGDYQPSGHLNVSRSRELYLTYTSNSSSGAYLITPSAPVDLIVLADCINFVLFKNGNMQLKFTT